MIRALLIGAFILQAIAVGYGVLLLARRPAAAAAWWFLLGAMLSMLTWRLFVMTGHQPPAAFNLVIAVWGSTCMLAAMYFLSREVARRERAESERDALLASERAARREAEHASEVKDEFLATLSHELRTPLTAMLGWCALLKMRADKTDVPRGLDIIERNARTQARLVDDLLDATRIRAGKLQPDFTLVRLDGPVLAAVEALRPEAARKDVTLHFAAETSPMIRADIVRLQQIAANLLVNAIKFTPSGGIVSVSVSSDADGARLVVSDTGEGIPPEFLPHVFTRFRQADRFAGRRHGGLGLGLAIVADLVRLHGGTVQAESEGPGRGATFTVIFPLARDGRTDAGPPAPPSSPEAIGPASLAGLRILVVDDEPDVRATLVRLLEEFGAAATAVGSSDEVEPALAGDLKPDVLLVDISMPGEDGYSLIRRLRRLPPAQGGAVPAISLTAHAGSEDRARALESGFQDHQPKPVDMPALVASLRALVHREPPAPRGVTRPA